MKRKTIVLFFAIILAIILFSISTYLQRKIVNYEPTIECLIVKEEIKSNQKLTEDMFYKTKINISAVSNIKVVSNFESINGLYSKTDLYKGQLAISKAFGAKEELDIYEVEYGKEKISIKIKNPENGVSYLLKPNSNINIYVTLRNDLANDFLKEKERFMIGMKEEGYTTIQILENVVVLDVFDSDGQKIDEGNSNNTDTIVIAVTKEEAKIINLLRDIATFNITENSMDINREKSGDIE